MANLGVSQEEVVILDQNILPSLIQLVEEDKRSLNGDQDHTAL